MHTRLDIKTKLTQRWPGPFTGALCHLSPPSDPLKQHGAPSPHPGWATSLLFLICFPSTVSQPKEKSVATEAQGHPSPAGDWEHNQGQGIWPGKGTEATNAPGTFHPLLEQNCFSVKGYDHTGLLAHVPHMYSVKPLSIFSKPIISELPWINDAQHLHVTWAISLETLLINSHFTIESFIPRSRTRVFSWSCVIWLYFHKSY